MHWWYGGWRGGGLLMMLFWAVVIVGIVWLLKGRPAHNGRNDNHQRHLPKETALEILQKRYAAGEISKEEYREMKDELSR